MKRLLLILFSLASCAAIHPSGYEEAETCPSPMTQSQAESGIVRCRALCSSYARDFAGFGLDCKCYCRGSAGQGGYVPQAHQASFSP